MAELCVDVGSIGSHFESLTDPRHTRNRKHLLVDIVVISLCGILCGANGPTAIHRWAKYKHEWLAKPLALPHGIPSRDCLRRLLMILKPEAFQKCFQEWIASGVEADATGQRRLVVIDGPPRRIVGVRTTLPKIGDHCTSSARGPGSRGSRWGKSPPTISPTIRPRRTRIADTPGSHQHDRDH